MNKLVKNVRLSFTYFCVYIDTLATLYMQNHHINVNFQNK